MDTASLPYPTPFYAYDAAIIRARVAELTDAFKGQNVSLHYAVKANDNPAVVAIAAQAGIGACLVSGGEMKRALAGGMKPDMMLMNGVGKSDADIKTALEHGIGQLNVESLPELERIADIAEQLGVKAVICLRLNPEIVAQAHTHTITARRTDKFGLLVEDLPHAREIIARHPSLDWRGFSCHIGSQIHGVEELAAGYRIMADLFRSEKASQPQFDRLDLGGGFGVSVFAVASGVDAGLVAAGLDASAICAVAAGAGAVVSASSTTTRALAPLPSRLARRRAASASARVANGPMRTRQAGSPLSRVASL